MSTLSELYQSVPRDERTCEGCDKPIIRNGTVFDGKPYHHGCLKRTKAKPTHQCQDCFSYLTAKGMSRTDFGDGRPIRTCGNCGSQLLKPLRKWRSYNG